MTTLREAAQQALEALEDVDGPITALLGGILGSPDPDAPGAKVRASITAIRAALAQEQAEPVVPQAEPLNLSDRAVQRRLAAQWGYVPAQAEPAQEPVAWMHPHKPDQIRLSPQDGWLPLVIAPPPRTMVPLTEREIEHIHLYLSSTVGSSYKTVARAIEKASWEKNHG